MSILKYIENYQNVSFTESPLNEVDIAIFSALSYLVYDEEFKAKRALIPLLRSITKKDKSYYKDMYRGSDLKKYLEAIIKAKRYKQIMISDYVDEIDYDTEKQFSAIVYHVPNSPKLILYRGTDRLLISWKEDFNMSYQKSIPAQKDALKYLNRMLLKYRGKVIVAGHSKGGNLAIFASGNALGLLRSKITKVYSFDAPGFDEDIAINIREKKLKITNYYPKDTVVGMCMYSVGEKIFVDSYKKRMYQHDLLNWKVFDDSFILAEQSKFSKFINEVLNEWLRKYDNHQKEVFFNELFDILDAKDGTKVSDMSKIKSIINYIQKIGTNYGKLSNEEKKALKENISQFVSIGKKAYDKNK